MTVNAKTQLLPNNTTNADAQPKTGLLAVFPASVHPYLELIRFEKVREVALQLPTTFLDRI